MATRTSVAPLPGAGAKRTAPWWWTSEPGSERHTSSSPGRSSRISASHCQRSPAGPRAVHSERPAPRGSTDSIPAMNRGAFSSARQKA